MQKPSSTQNLTPAINVFQMYDTKTQSFSYPLYFDTDDAASSWFDLITNTHGAGPTHTHSEDFVIYHIGIYDAESGHTTYFDERKFHLSLQGLRRSCKACDDHAAKSKQFIETHHPKGEC